MKTLDDISESISIKENMQSDNIKSGPDTTTSTMDGKTTADGCCNTTTMKKPPPSQSLAPHPPSVLLVESSSHNTSSNTSMVPSSKLSLTVPESTGSNNKDTTTDTPTTATTKTAVDQSFNPIPPTYQSSEESMYYTNAKALLQSGDFETALSTIEEGIQWTKQQLVLIQNSTIKSDTDPATTENSAALHESMAPFHYLYGTTLLYSIEEAPDDGLQPLTTMEGGQGGEPSSQSGEEDEDAGDDDDEEEGPYIDTNNMGYEDNEELQQQGPQGTVEDMEIAWENLDAARIIVERMLQTHPTSDKLRMDMGQILLREGDLQRMNGAYMAAITDYTNCLSYYENNSMISPFCRKVADVHCNLGSVYFNSVVEMKKGPADTDKDNGVPQQKETMTMSDPTLMKKIIFHRNRGFYHYYECAKTLVGMIVQVLSSSESSSTKPMDPMVVFQEVDEKQSFPSSYYNERSDEYPTMIRSKLHSLIQDVTSLSKSIDVSSFHDSDLILDSIALLEEIQETIDEAETSEQGVVEATAMKKEITALVASQQQGMPEDSDGNAISASTSTTNGFGSAAAAASTAMAQPILIVKKKKKTTQQEAMDEFGMDVKLPAIRNDSNKRMKSSE